MVKSGPASIIFAACISAAALCWASLPLAAQPETTARTVAVLYFQDLGPSPEAKPLRKALAQMIITDLSRVEGLEVLQRERIERFVAETGIGESGLSSADTAVLAGRALQADYVVQGTFSATSKQITVEVRVGSREGTAAVFSRTFSRPMEEFMQLEQEIIQAIVEAAGVEPVLRAAPSPQEGVVSPAVAVMDFENLSTSGELDPLQAPLSDMFCATLSQIPEVTLVERARIKDVIKELGLAATGLVDPQTAARLGRLLGAQRMLVSSFIAMGGILRFDSHLIDTESGQLVAALSVSGPRDEYAGLTEELARQAAAALRVSMPSAAEQAVKADAPTESWEAYTYLKKSLYYNSLGRPQQALEEMLRCLYLEPNCARALDWATLMAAQLKRADLTVELAQRIITTYSSDPDKRWLVRNAYSYLRLLYAHLRQPEKELAAIERLLRLDVSDAAKMSLLIDKADCLKALGRATPDVLLSIYRQVLEYPSDKGAFRLFAAVEAATIFVEHNEMDNAILIILKAAAAPPEPSRGCERPFLEMVDKLLQYSLEKNDLESARKLVEMSIQRCPDEASATGWDDLHRAQLYEAEGKLDEAIQSYGKVVELRYPQSFFEALLKIGDLYLEKGDVRRAVEAYQRMMRCAGGSHHTKVLRPVAQAVARLRELGIAVPTPEGYQPNFILTQQFGHATMILGDNDYLLDLLSVLPVNNPSEVLCPYQTVVMEWPKGGQPWWVTQSWLNFVRRGGGLLLSMARYIQRPATGPLRTNLGVAPPRGQSFARSPLAASGQHPAGQGLEGLRASLRCPLECDKELVLATESYGDRPALAAIEYGLGRALVAGFDVVPPAEDFILPAFDWLRQEQTEGKRAQLLVRFRAVSDSWARQDYSQAIGVLQNISTDYAGTEYEELALYTIGDILQNSLKNYDRAGRQFQQVYTKFPKGELALPARMAAADCAQMAGAGEAELLKLYAGAVEIGSDTEIAATAQLKIGFIHLLADRLEDATAALRKAVNDFPAGYAKNNALYALGYCYEQTGRIPDAQRAYQSILDITRRAEPPDPIYPECFPEVWELFLTKDDRADQSESEARAERLAKAIWSSQSTERYRQPGHVALQTLAEWRLQQLLKGSGAPE